MTVSRDLQEPPVSAVDYRAFALRIAHRDDPRTLLWVGIVLLVFGAINTVLPPPTPVPILFGDLVLGVSMIASGMWLDRPRTPDWQVPWAFVGVMTVFVWWMLVIYLQEAEEANLVYVVVAMTAIGPLSFGWRPFLASAALMLAGCYIFLELVSQVRESDWMVGFLAALVVSGVLLRLRLRLLAELADAERVTMDLSTADALTGLMNRHGMNERLATTWADAIRREEPITVYFLDVRGLKKANDEHGHDVGDDAIRDVAETLRATMRGSDLIARWGGDEFVILGLGEGPMADTLAARLNERFLAISAVRRRGWIGDISVGRAQGSPEQYSFEELLEVADADMYARRADPGAHFTVTIVVMGGNTHFYATCMHCAHTTDAYDSGDQARAAYEEHACAAA